MDDLEGRLEQLAAQIDFPDTPDLSVHVRARLGLSAQSGARRLRPWRAITASTLVVAVALVLAVAPIRQAVADWLGIGGVRISLTDEPLPDVDPVDIDLGRRVSIDEAQKVIDFQLQTPASLGDPDEVRIATTPAGTLVYLVFATNGDLPPVADTGIGAILTQFQGGLDRDILLKVVSTETVVETTTVRDVDGFWISGDPHLIGYLDPTNGGLVTDSTRLAGNTLLWEEAGVTHRIESSLNLTQTLEIADSLRVVP